MPTPDRTSLDEIVRAGRDILETDGMAGLTMQAVAQRVGVRAPSLYKRVANRDALVGLVAEVTVRELGARMADATGQGEARAQLAGFAHALRDFARSAPAAFHLIFAAGPESTRPAPESLAHATVPLLRAAEQLVGPGLALQAARTLTAWANGFITMELAGAFRLGGDVDDAFEFGVRHITAALERATLSGDHPNRH